jgi:hypothetical protein
MKITLFICKILFPGEREHQCFKCGKRFQALSALTKVIYH